MCSDSSSGRAPACKAGDLGSNPGPGANFFLTILTYNCSVYEYTEYKY